MKAVIITGDRHANREVWAHQVSAAIERFDTVIHGACGVDADDAREKWSAKMKGIDWFAHVYARTRGLTVLAMPAPFNREGPKGGPMRNGQMLNVLKALEFVGYTIEVHAFHDDLASGSRGTKDMVQKAMSAGVPTFVHRSDGTVL